MMKVDNKSWLFIEFIIFYCLISSAQAVCTMGQNTYIDLVLSIVVFFYFYSKKMFVLTDKRIIATFFLTIAIIWSMHGSAVYAYIGELIITFIPIMIINLRRDKQIELLSFLTKALSVAFIISFVAWISTRIGLISLPHKTVFVESDYSYGAMLNNYFFFLDVTSLNYDGREIVKEYFRFNGFFLEPGHAGTIAAFFLIANCYDFSKWYNKTLLVVIIFTLSAAAYVLVIIGFVLKIIVELKDIRSFSYLIVILICIFVVFQYNGGDNILRDVVFEKIMGNDRGLENRFTDEVSRAYENMWDNGDFMFGSSQTINVSHSAGYKVFLLQQGVLGLLLVLIAYFSIQKAFPSNLGFCFFVVVAISFLQRIYFKWDAFLIPYILGLSNFYQINKKTYK